MVTVMDELTDWIPHRIYVHFQMLDKIELIMSNCSHEIHHLNLEDPKKQE